MHRRHRCGTGTFARYASTTLERRDSKGDSHRIYKTLWAGDPRVNIQNGDGGSAKPCQVKQVLAATAKLEEKP